MEPRIGLFSLRRSIGSELSPRNPPRLSRTFRFSPEKGLTAFDRKTVPPNTNPQVSGNNPPRTSEPISPWGRKKRNETRTPFPRGRRRRQRGGSDGGNPQQEVRGLAVRGALRLFGCPRFHPAHSGRARPPGIQCGLFLRSGFYFDPFRTFLLLCFGASKRAEDGKAKARTASAAACPQPSFLSVLGRRPAFFPSRWHYTGNVWPWSSEEAESSGEWARKQLILAEKCVSTLRWLFSGYFEDKTYHAALGPVVCHECFFVRNVCRH